MTTQPMNIQTQAYEVLERVVKARGTSGGVYLPVSWTGKRVKVLLLDPIEEEKLTNEHEAGDVVPDRVCPECGSRLVWRKRKTSTGGIVCWLYKLRWRMQVSRKGSIKRTELKIFIERCE